MSGLGLVWNAIGLAAFFAQMTMDFSALAEAERVFYETMPSWATAAFAVAVFGGVLGCLALLVRKRWAVMVLLVSLLGIIVQISHSLLISNGIEVFGPEGMVLPFLTFSIAVLLVFFANYSNKRGWLT